MTEPSPELPDEQPPKAEAAEHVDTVADTEERNGAAVADGGEAVSSTTGHADEAEAVTDKDNAEADDQKRLDYENDEEEDEEEEDDDDEEEDDEDEEDEDEEDEEPRLNYARITQNIASVYRNGDATSAFLVAGDKLVRT